MTDIRRFACFTCGTIYQQDLHSAQISLLTFKIQCLCPDCRQNIPSPPSGMNAEEFYLQFFIND